MSELSEERRIQADGIKRLAIAVLVKSINEYKDGDQDAKNFLNSKRALMWCELAGLPINILRNKMKDTKVKLREDIVVQLRKEERALNSHRICEKRKPRIVHDPKERAKNVALLYADIDKIKKRIEQGGYPKKIAKEYNVSSYTIYRMFKQHNIKSNYYKEKKI